MDADCRCIPITEDDQGEGFKDPLEIFADIRAAEEATVDRQDRFFAEIRKRQQRKDRYRRVTL